MTIHVGGADIRAHVVPITDPDLRRRVLTHSETSWYRTQAELEQMVATAPMVEVVFER